MHDNKVEESAKIDRQYLLSNLIEVEENEKDNNCMHEKEKMIMPKIDRINIKYQCYERCCRLSVY